MKMSLFSLESLLSFLLPNVVKKQIQTSLTCISDYIQHIEFPDIGSEVPAKF